MAVAHSQIDAFALIEKALGAVTAPKLIAGFQ
jgi:hypothetical protein